MSPAGRRRRADDPDVVPASPTAFARGASRWARSYPLAPRYRPPATVLRLRSADGTPLAAVRVPGPDDALASVVVVHGFSNWSRTARSTGS